MSEASLAVEVQGVPAAPPPPPLNSIKQISIGADKFFRTQADSGRWVPGSAQPAAVWGVRLHELILSLRGSTGESAAGNIQAGTRFRGLGPDGLPGSRFSRGAGIISSHKVAADYSPDTVSALKRAGPPHPHEPLMALRGAALHPGGDPVPASRPWPVPAGGHKPRHPPGLPAASGAASPL
jgi:hypothetical protein